MNIATDKRGYPHIIFLISLRKLMLWVLISSASSARNKKDISIFQMKKAPYLLLCMKCQILFSGKNNKYISVCHLLKI